MPFQVKWAVPYCIWIAKSARIEKTIGHCRSIKSRSNDCRCNKCRSNDCRSIECRSNDIIPACLPHDLLLLKLKSYGVAPSSLNLFESYLNNRKQCVKVGTHSSNWQTMFYKRVSILFKSF
jgi:hypothetical protein